MNPKDVNYNIIIFILMIVTGFIIYFMYFQSIEKFAPGDPPNTPIDPIPTPTPSSSDPIPTPSNSGPIPSSSNTLTTIPICLPPALKNVAVLSRYFGIGFNIDYVKYNNEDVYLINHIPVLSNGTLGGSYGITQDSLLTIKLKNSKDNTLLWSMTEYTDTIGPYFVVNPITNKNFSLQYESGNLALRPFNTKNIFEAQKWVMSPYKITRGIPVLNYSPASLFTSEFDPYSTPEPNTSNITYSNMQQITDVVTSVKSGIQRYLGELTKKKQSEQISSSSLGQKDHPLNINFNVSSDQNTSILPTNEFKKSNFADVNSSKISSEADFLSIMDKYGPSSSSGRNSSNNIQLYKKSDLDNEISKSQGCKILNIKDYTSNRVGSCNCKL